MWEREENNELERKKRRYGKKMKDRYEGLEDGMEGGREGKKWGVYGEDGEVENVDGGGSERG